MLVIKLKNIIQEKANLNQMACGTRVMFSLFSLVNVCRSISHSRVVIVRFEDGLKKTRRRKLLPNERKKQTKVIPSLCTLLKYSPSLYHVCLFFTTQNTTPTNTNKIEWRGDGEAGAGQFMTDYHPLTAWSQVPPVSLSVSLHA